MAKHKRKFFDYETTSPLKDKYITLSKTLMLHPNYMSLSSSAKELYSYMKLWASGRQELRYSNTLAKDLMSKPTFLKSRNELVNKGFLEIIETSKQIGFTTKYRFTDKWK